MADFRTKLIMLAGAATMFAGMAFGQATVASNGVASSAIFVRSEGTTELVAPSTVTVTQPAGAPAASLNLTVYLSPSVAITSQAKGNPAVSETSATPAGGAAVFGTVSGSSVSFSGIVIPANGGGAPVTTVVTIANIRVNASTIAVASGVPTGVSETVFVGGTGVTPIVPTPVTVAYALNGLGAVKATAATNNTICGGSTVNTSGAAGVNFNVTVADGFAGAFKTKADETNGSTISATSGTRIAVTFGNVPANVSVYVPLTVYDVTPSAGPPVVVNKVAMTNVTSATGAITASSDAKVKNETQPLAAVTIANNTGTTYYEVTTDNLGAINTYVIPVYLVNAAGSLSAPASAITATVSFAPIGSSSSVPNFVNGSSTATVNGSTYVACSTTLLFPYLTNVSGFESGIALANTSLDNLGISGTTGLANGSNSVASQNGTCSLYFYGNATVANNPAAYTTPVVTAGTTNAFTLTAAAGAGFTGYALAECNFQYAHGFTYIVYNFGTSSGVAMGYVAYPIAQPRGLVGGIEALGN